MFAIAINLIRSACNSLSETKANLINKFAVKSLLNEHRVSRNALNSKLVSYSAL